MIESRYLNTLAQKVEFPYAGVPSGNSKSFKGRNRLLLGYLEKTRFDLNLGTNEAQLHVPAETKYFEMHFVTKQRRIEDSKTHKVVKTMLKGAEDLIDLTDELKEKKKYKEIDLFVGTTNQRMARLAVRHFGFHYGNPEIMESRKKQKKGEDQHVTIFITKKELLDQRVKINQIKGMLEKRK